MDSDFNAIIIAPEDNVVTVIRQTVPDETVRFLRLGEVVEVVSRGVPIYHKLAVTDIPMGEEIEKYGEVIGVATEDIPKGAHVHCHNITSGVQ